MRAYVARGEPARALSAYERLRADLASELGVDPAPQTRDLHTAVLRGTDPGDEPAPAHRAAPSGLAGRADEQRWLERVWGAASTGRGGLVLLTGEAGIGKTRLAEHAIALAQAAGRDRAAGPVLRHGTVVVPATVRGAVVRVGCRGLSTTDLDALAGGRADALAGLVPELAVGAGPTGGSGPTPRPATPTCSGGGSSRR